MIKVPSNIHDILKYNHCLTENGSLPIQDFYIGVSQSLIRCC